MVIEDVVTTGGTTREVIDCCGRPASRVLAAGSIIDRSGGRVGPGRSPRGAGDADVVA